MRGYWRRTVAFHEARVEELAGAVRVARTEPDAPAWRRGIAAFVVPGLAFTGRAGGSGGRGHYDATLAAAPGALRLGLAYERQLIEHVAREAHDVALHIIITEVATHVVA
jgi:5-formyltetrahydrofolate cyclo-ligase